MIDQMKDTTEQLLDQLHYTAEDVVYSAKDLLEAHIEARYEFDRLHCEDDFIITNMEPGEDLAQDFSDGVDAAVDYTKKFHAELTRFDEQLMELIQLRGKLAEELDIPIGGAKWVRYETYTM